MNSTRTIYLKCLNNRELLSIIECINNAGREIPPFLVVIGINILAPWFINNLNPHVIVITSEIGFDNNWISLQWIKYFERYSRREQVDSRRLLLMNSYKSHDTYEFLKYYEKHNIISLLFPSYIIYLLQSLNVCVFQPLKYYYSKVLS